MADFSNMQIQKVILHKVFPPDDEGQVNPTISAQLTSLADAGKRALQKRMTEVLGSGSHCIEMEIDKTDSMSCFYNVCDTLNNNTADFISKSAGFANLHTTAHTSKRWPGGTLVIIYATVGVQNKKCILIIKAEAHEGFAGKIADNKVTMEYVENLLLTPQTKLYKVGAFVEDEATGSGTYNSSQFSAFVYDSNITAKDDRKAARYFYSNFLGLRIPVNSKQRTRDFFEFTKEFVNSSALPTEKKIDINNALYTYLKTDQSGTVSVSSFSDLYFDPDTADQYSEFMANKEFPQGSVSKELDLIANSLRLRKINFSSNVTISAKEEAFRESVKVIESSDDETILRIKGRLLNQQS